MTIPASVTMVVFAVGSRQLQEVQPANSKTW
jgi:hypothetical protein